MKIYVDYLRLVTQDLNMEQEQREPSEAEVMEMLRYLRKRAMWRSIYEASLFVLQTITVFICGFAVGNNW
jgi:hypothetical protein